MEFNTLCWCIKCRQKVIMKNCAVEYCKDGTPQAIGNCEKCNTQIMRLLNKIEKGELYEQGKI